MLPLAQQIRQRRLDDIAECREDRDALAPARQRAPRRGRRPRPGRGRRGAAPRGCQGPPPGAPVARAPAAPPSARRPRAAPPSLALRLRALERRAAVAPGLAPRGASGEEAAASAALAQALPWRPSAEMA